MSANIKEILIIGATSGLGEAFARRLHAQGKKVIITGRRQDRLDDISSSVGTSGNSISTQQWDVSDFASIPKTVEAILQAHPNLDTVFVNAGIMRTPSFTDPSNIDPSELTAEINTNFTAVVLLAQAFMPHLLKIASQQKHAAFLATSSGLAFSPSPMAPVYCATKAALHSFLVSVRQQVAQHEDTNVYQYLSICEIVPPMVETDIIKSLTGAKTPAAALTLEDYMNDAMSKLDAGEEGGKLKKEIATGSAQFRLDAWRGSIGQIITEKFGLKE